MQLFVKNQDHSSTYVRLYVTFEAKVIKGSHKFRVVCRSFKKNEWIHGASFLNFEINNSEYQKYRREMKLPVGDDFRIQVDVLQNENENSSIQIKDFKVVKFS